jgi:hypothetical protein
MSLQRSIAIAAAVVVLAGCGSAADSVTFEAPSGYTQTASIGPFMQIWSGPKQNRLMLMALPTQVDIHKAVSNSNVQDEHVEQQAQIEICGHQPAYYVSMTGTSSDPAGSGPKTRHQVDFLATAANGKTYIAMYFRPVGTPADPSAESAIHNVCPK